MVCWFHHFPKLALWFSYLHDNQIPCHHPFTIKQRALDFSLYLHKLYSLHKTLHICFPFKLYLVFIFLTCNGWSMLSYFQGIKSSVRTSSGMFLNREEKKYPMIQVGLLSELVFNFFYYNINSNHFLASLEDTESLFISSEVLCLLLVAVVVVLLM